MKFINDLSVIIVTLLIVIIDIFSEIGVAFIVNPVHLKAY